MADPHLLEFLLRTIEQDGGAERWSSRKARCRILDLTNADFTGCRMPQFDFAGAMLSTAIFVNADLDGVDFTSAELSYADMRGANLSNSRLDQADLRSANLQGARMHDASLGGTNLTEAALAQADLLGADLTGADLSGADLRGACLKFTQLKGAILDGADVAFADLTGSVLDDDAPLQFKNFHKAIVDDREYRSLRSSIKTSAGTEVAVIDGGAETPEKASARGKSAASRFGDKLRARLRREVNSASGNGAAVACEEDLKTEEGWYRILDIEPGASLAGITKAFRQRARQYHPDKNRELSEEEIEICELQFYLARQAYERLTALRAKPLTNLEWPPEVPRRASPFHYSVDEYLALARANPRNTNVLYNLAWKYFEAGMMDESIETYEKVLFVDPSDEDADFNLRIVRLARSLDLPPEPLLEART